jgi:hypothetical protein
MGCGQRPFIPSPALAVEHDGQIEGDGYIFKEAAFEAIIGAASLSIKDGHNVTITIPRQGR